jgi:DNA gyrase/topoisomerase IV subunit B
MAKGRYTPDDIQVIDAMTAIRARPDMYVGKLDEPAAINKLLIESLCIALDNATSGCASEVDIRIHDDGSASVRDNGPGLNVEIVRDGLTAIEMLLTRLYSCREAKRNKVNEGLCGIGIVVTNALSNSLTIETGQDGWIWQQQYACGRAQGPIHKTGPSSQQWQQITFHPDPAIFGSQRLSPGYFADWFGQQELELGSSIVTFHHSATSIRLYDGLGRDS